MFEAAFEADHVFISADVLEKTANGGWRLIEVKSSSSAKDEHVPDAGVQTHVLMRNGIQLDGVDIMHLNCDPAS